MGWRILEFMFGRVASAAAVRELEGKLEEERRRRVAAQQLLDKADDEIDLLRAVRGQTLTKDQVVAVFSGARREPWYVAMCQLLDAHAQAEVERAGDPRETDRAATLACGGAAVLRQFRQEMDLQVTAAEKAAGRPA